MNDRYKMLKNFLHNEMQISKEEIEGWVTEAIKNEVKIQVHRWMQTRSVEECLRDIINKELKNALSGFPSYSEKVKIQELMSKQVVAQLLEGFNITIESKIK